jgi:hypothetical protein
LAHFALPRSPSPENRADWWVRLASHARLPAPSLSRQLVGPRHSLPAPARLASVPGPKASATSSQRTRPSMAGVTTVPRAESGRRLQQTPCNHHSRPRAIRIERRRSRSALHALLHHPKIHQQARREELADSRRTGITSSAQPCSRQVSSWVRPVLG